MNDQEPTAVGRSRENQLAEALRGALAEVVRDAVVAVAPSGRLLFWNARFVELWGPPLDLLHAGRGRELFEWLAAQSAAPDALRAALGDDAPGSGEATLGDGRRIAWDRAAAQAPGAGVVGRVFAFRDATELERVKGALLEAQHRLRIVSAHIEGIVFELDASARFVRVWTSDPGLLARPEPELIGRTLIETLGEAEGRAFDDRIRRVLATGQPESFEYELDVPGGRRAFAQDAVVAPAPPGAPRTVTVMTRDVTERKRMQAQLQQAERLASVGLLAAGVAHEINNPLAYIMLNLERLRNELRTLAQEQPSPRVRALEDSVAMMWEGAERVRSIVRDLKTFSRPDDEAARRAVDVHRVLELSAEMASAEVRHRARLVRDFGAAPLVAANENRLTQVFVNLVVNAAHAIPEGQADRNLIRLATRTDARGWVVVEVSDTGRGIPAAILPRVFDPFFTTKDTGAGTGLGLSICHGIVKALGGEISVESAEGRGSTFRVVLPPATGAYETPAAPTGNAPPPTARRGRVLVVDDEPAIGAAIRLALEDEWDVVSVTSAQDGLARVEDEGPFDAVICDLVMPTMSGHEFYTALERIAPEHARRVVFITGGEPSPAVQALLEERPNAWLAKPFGAAELRALVAAQLGK